MKKSFHITSRDFTVYICCENILIFFFFCFIQFLLYTPLPTSSPSCPSDERLQWQSQSHIINITLPSYLLSWMLDLSTDYKRLPSVFLVTLIYSLSISSPFAIDYNWKEETLLHPCINHCWIYIQTIFCIVKWLLKIYSNIRTGHLVTNCSFNSGKHWLK